MAKTILALHRAGVKERLLAPQLRAALSGAGARLLQVNVDDEPVAAAMRFGPGEPITAVVSLVHDGDPAPLVELVRGAVQSVHAWAVEERVPLPPPTAPDAERAPALANVAFLRRPSDLPAEQWRRIWLEEHTQVAIDTQATFGYLQHPVLAKLTPQAPDVAGIVEELFPPAAVSDRHAFYGSGGDETEFRRRFETLMTSCARFGADQDLCLVPTSRYVFAL